MVTNHDVKVHFKMAIRLNYEQVIGCSTMASSFRMVMERIWEQLVSMSTFVISFYSL